MKSQKNRDLDLALNLHEELNVLGVTENAIIPKNKNEEKYKPRTLIDQTLELIDPTPNIYTLFVQFNARFFWNVLLPVEVKWSNRMTSCAGICYYHPRNKQCVISLSIPLLKLRPRKDLVETLLHEMIHGYLFITNNNRDRDGHGPEFCKHMNRINKEAGTNITIYHSFHDEVRLYKQHWWRCDGPCQKKAPYFGTVRRAMNRAPGPSDFWWKEHQQSCGGQFIKIKEPENFKKQNTKTNQKSKTVLKNNPNENNITNWLMKSNNSSQEYKTNDMPTSKVRPVSKLSNIENEKTKNVSKNNYTYSSPINVKTSNTHLDKNVKKLGNNTNNVHGWGVGGPNSSSATKVINNTHSGQPKFTCSGQLGGSQTGKSNLLDKFGVKTNTGNRTLKSPQGKMNVNQNDSSNKKATKSVNCPICNIPVCINIINEHIDSCLDNKDKQKSYDILKPSDNIIESKNNVTHNNSGSPTDTLSIKWKDCKSSTPKRSNTIYVSSNKRLKTEDLDKPKLADCPICHMSFKIEDIHNHLDICLSEQHTSSSSHNFDNTIIINSSTDSDSPNSILIDSPDTAVNTSSSHRKNDALHETHKCLVCNMIITPTMSLNEHLEECMGTVFNDESTSFSEYEDDNSEGTHVPDQKYPCPVCMELFAENTMNEHLDMCLKGK
ncbi:hypothetical protein KPH14_002815 [Odynerus spinipes]|uniref:Protein with SprT-like domain at the N terminus n=1 Tax=Odynerus spinipes TaxID=1348599 RepID=A0AAD9RH84_9HYME|nr:hypothetical protein KPH14_002815 [Odynerus spinipes]